MTQSRRVTLSGRYHRVAEDLILDVIIGKCLADSRIGLSSHLDIPQLIDTMSGSHANNEIDVLTYSLQKGQDDVQI